VQGVGSVARDGLDERNAAESLAANFLEIAGATLAFALLCAGASALRNFIARRLIWPEDP